MKKTLFAMCALFIGMSASDAKSLVAYYSRSGNTKTVAEIVKTATGADIFEITTSDPSHYPADYSATTEVAQSEITNGNYPAINPVPALSDYDTIFIGTPTWWGTMAGPVHTFLTTVDLSGKTVIPFNTHEGSGAGNVHTDIAALTPNSAHLDGIAIRGGDAANSGEDVKEWLTKIGK